MKADVQPVGPPGLASSVVHLIPLPDVPLADLSLPSYQTALALADSYASCVAAPSDLLSLRLCVLFCWQQQQGRHLPYS